MANSQLPTAKAPNSRLREKTRAALIERQVAELYLRGWTIFEICNRLGLYAPRVGQILRKLIIEWKEQAILNIGEAKSVELQRLNLVERTAWENFRRSQIGPKDEATGKYQEQEGNSIWLRVALDCIDRRCKILGLDEPEKIQAAVTVGEKFVAREAMERDVYAVLAKIPGTRFYVPPGAVIDAETQLAEVAVAALPSPEESNGHAHNGNSHNGNGSHHA